MKITFCGAARIVTGSCYLLEISKQKLLVDCGMFQGSKEVVQLNYKGFPFDPSDITTVLLTHAHIDHSGLLPKLAAEGFEGEIIATSPTTDLCRIMLEDSATMQVGETDAENKRRLRTGLEPRNPLYTKEDALAACKLFRRVQYGKTYELPGGIKFRYRDAGHIIGSAIIEVWAEGKKLVFSGDLGQWNNPIVNDPELIDDADYVFVESTYGDRLHEDFDKREELFLKYAKETYKKGGKLLIPSFAVERTQELLYAINKMRRAKKFPNEEVFLDSPLAIKATQIFLKYAENFDQEAASMSDPFGLSEVTFTADAKKSMKLNSYAQPCVIMAGSGMCTGGRIRHHFKHGIWDPKNTVLFVGYQAEGTLGRVILDGAKEIKMMGMGLVVKANIRKIDGFSAHADYKGLIKWVEGFKKRPRLTFIMHGEPKASEALSKRLTKEGFKCKVPSMLQTVELT